jgi:hypothetical protein
MFRVLILLLLGLTINVSSSSVNVIVNVNSDSHREKEVVTRSHRRLRGNDHEYQTAGNDYEYQEATPRNPFAGTCPLPLTSYPVRNGNQYTCAMYNCLDQLYRCSTTAEPKDRYPIDYGLKYCNRFSSRTGSVNFNQWRDATLKCLQDELKVFLTANPTRSCADLTKFAFDSHPKCYTVPGSSICQLSIREKAMVGLSVSPNDLLSLRSAKQMALVLKTCGGDAVAAVNRGARRSWNWIKDRIPEETVD